MKCAIEQDNAVAASAIGNFLKEEFIRSFGPVVLHQTQRISWLQTVKRWEFPTNGLVTYDRSDEPWCRYFGIGKDVIEKQSIVVPVAVPIYSSLGELAWMALVPAEITICE